MLAESCGTYALDTSQFGDVGGLILRYQGDCGISENCERRPAPLLRFVSTIVPKSLHDLLAG